MFKGLNLALVAFANGWCWSKEVFKIQIIFVSEVRRWWCSRYHLKKKNFESVKFLNFLMKMPWILATMKHNAAKADNTNDRIMNFGSFEFEQWQNGTTHFWTLTTIFIYNFWWKQLISLLYHYVMLAQYYTRFKSSLFETFIIQVHSNPLSFHLFFITLNIMHWRNHLVTWRTRKRALKFTTSDDQCSIDQ